MKKRCLLYILTLLLVVTGIPSDAWAEPVTENGLTQEAGEADIQKALEAEVETVEKNGLDEYLERNGIFRGTVSNEEDYGSPEREMVSYPSRYDPRETGMVSKVRHQVGGTCWLFGAMAAVESNLIKKGLVTNDIDLSELQVGYFLFNSHVDRLGYYTNNTKQSYNVDNLWDYINGGTEEEILDLISCWAAPVYESDASFYIKGPYIDESLTKDQVNALVLDEALTDKEYWHFKGAKFCDYDESEKSQNDVKYLITTYGGVSASYYDNSNYMRIVEEGGEASYYYPYDIKSANHAIEIVGWDDNYPKENFVSRPEGDGAFLCKNSWGEFGDGTGRYTNGYYWISYYDETLMNVMAVEMDRADIYENIYAHDGGTRAGAGVGERVANLNIYTARAYGEGTVEKVDGVMTYLFRNTPYELTLYLNPVVEDGKLVSYSGKSKTYTGTSDFTGFYTIDTSSDPLYVPYGSTYGILIENEDGNIGGAGGTKNVDFNTCFIGKDASSLQDCKTLNVHIPSLRGLTNKAENFVPSEKVTLSESRITLESGEGATLTGSVSPANATVGRLTYYSTDDKVASVDDDGHVTAEGPGECVIYAYASDGNSVATCDVEVNFKSFSLKSLAVEKNKTQSMETIFGETFAYYPGNEAFTWEISDETIAGIDENGCVTGHKEGTATVTATYKRDTTLKAECEITVYSLAESITFGVSYNSMRISEGMSVDLRAVITPEGASQEVSYIVQNPEDREVIRYENGILTAVQPGSARITATTTDGTQKSETVEIKVWASAILQYNFPIQGELQLEAGQSQEMSIYVRGENPEYEKYISVTSSNPEVVEVTKNIYNKYGLGSFEVRAVSEGTAVVTVKANDKNGSSLSYNVTVGTPQQPAPAQKTEPKVKVKDVKYHLKSDGTAEIYDVSKKKNTYTVSSKITYDGKQYTVTKIAKNAFSGNKKLTSIKLPSTIKEIGNNAFSGCSKLKSITIPKNVTKIGKKAFYGCTKLKTVKITGKKVKSIGASAFKKMNKNAKIYVPKSKEEAYKKLLKNKYDKTTKIVKS